MYSTAVCNYYAGTYVLAGTVPLVTTYIITLRSGNGVTLTDPESSEEDNLNGNFYYAKDLFSFSLLNIHGALRELRTVLTFIKT